MTSCCTLPWEINLQQRVLHELSKIFWGKFVLCDTVDDGKTPLFFKTECLIIYRDRVLNNVAQVLNDVPKQFSLSLPQHMIGKVLNAVFNLQKGYYEALVWERKFSYYLPLTILNPVTAGKYYASNFIDATGYFNDLAWVKLFVNDERMDLKSRYSMATFYCLENVFLNLFSKRFLDVSSSHSNIKNCIEPMTIIFWLKKLFGEPSQDIEEFPDDIIITCLNSSIIDGYEYAAQYYWTICSKSQKEKFLNNVDYNCITRAARDKLSGIVHFLYILLTQEHKNILGFIQKMPLTGSSMGKIWYCLLDSEFYKCTLEDILTFPKSIPICVYHDILSSLISNIEKFNYPIQKKIFNTLWNHLSDIEKRKVLEISPRINTFLKIRETGHLKVIKPLSYPATNMIHLNDLEGAGRSALYELSKVDDYDDDTVLRYMLFYLIGKDSSTHKLRVRINAKNILESLKNDMCSKSFGDHSLAKYAISLEINRLRECLNLLNEVLKNLTEKHVLRK